MSDQVSMRRPSEATLDQATEEYVRALEAGVSPDINEFARKYGIEAAELEEFARDYHRVAAILSPQPSTRKMGCRRSSSNSATMCLKVNPWAVVAWASSTRLARLVSIELSQ